MTEDKTYRLMGADGRLYSGGSKGLLAATDERRFTECQIVPPHYVRSGADKLMSSAECFLRTMLRLSRLDFDYVGFA